MPLTVHYPFPLTVISELFSKKHHLFRIFIFKNLVKSLFLTHQKIPNTHFFHDIFLDRRKKDGCPWALSCMHCSLALPTTVYSDEILTLQLCFLCGGVYMYICYRQNDWIQACLDLLHFFVLHSYCRFCCCCFVCFALYCFYQIEGFWQCRQTIKQVY